MKVEFDLDTTSTSKPVAGPDDLLLLLTHLWARDESVFPTEDDRHDVATIMLFQAYTGGRPAEFVHSSKGRASQDPLGEAENSDTKQRPRKRGAKGDGLQYDDDSGNDVSNCDDESDASGDGDAWEQDADESADHDSGYNSDRTDVLIVEDTDNNYTGKVEGSGEPMRDCDTMELDESAETIRKYKALCYEDICLWIVRNPRNGQRDVLAMEIHLQNHKGVDRKPKPYGPS